jgi:hypothetical protein
MVIRIDISSLPGHLRNVIMNEIGFKHRSERVSSGDSSEPLDINKDQGKSSNVADEIPVLDESDTHTTYQKIKDALIKNRISDYVAIKHQEEK